MRSRGLPQTLGTASALLTAQALQHGHDTAKWLLQPPALRAGSGEGGGGASSSSGSKAVGGGGSAAAVRLPDEAVESCLLGRGSPQACMERLLEGPFKGSSGSRAPFRPTTATANVVLAGLAVRGCTEDAFRLFEWMKQRQVDAEAKVAAAAAGAAHAQAPAVRAAGGGRSGSGGKQPALAVAPAPCAPDAWTLHLLLFAALNAPKDQQLELTLRALQEGR